MKRLALITAAILSLLASVSVSAQKVSKIEISVLDSAGVLDIDGVFFGVTFKQNLETRNTQLEAGYLTNLGFGWGAVSLDYDREYETYGPKLTYFTKVRDRLFGFAGAGPNFVDNIDYNYSVDFTAGFAYVPNWHPFGDETEIAFIPRFEITRHVDINKQDPSDPGSMGGIKQPVPDNDSGVHLTVAILGF